MRAPIGQIDVAVSIALATQAPRKLHFVESEFCELPANVSSHRKHIGVEIGERRSVSVARGFDTDRPQFTVAKRACPIDAERIGRAKRFACNAQHGVRRRHTKRRTANTPTRSDVDRPKCEIKIARRGRPTHFVHCVC